MFRRIILFALAMALALLVLYLAIVLGDNAPWYFAWVLGTGTIVLAAAAGGAMYDAQQEELSEHKHPDRT